MRVAVGIHGPLYINFVRARQLPLPRSFATFAADSDQGLSIHNKVAISTAISGPSFDFEGKGRVVHILIARFFVQIRGPVGKQNHPVARSI